jgi:hypothetical protein
MSSYKAIAYHKGQFDSGSYGHQAGPIRGSSIEYCIEEVKDELRLGIKLGGPCRPCFPIQIKVWGLVHTESGITEDDLAEVT